MDTTEIPLKINDNLADAFVEVFFDSAYSKRYLQELVKTSLESNGWNLTTIPFVQKDGVLTDKFFFSNGYVRFFVEDNRIGINCIGKYPGWSAYQKTITEILFATKGQVNFTDIHLKYVSIWQGIEIFDHLDGVVCVSQFPRRFDNTQLTFPAIYVHDTFKAEVLVRLIENIILDGMKCSQVEVDVKGKITSINIEVEGLVDYNSLNMMYCLEEAHSAEKDMFFKLLKKDFVDSLNPIWS